MKKLIACLVLCAAIISPIKAQQVESFALMEENAFILNPAYAGTEGYVHGYLTGRDEFEHINNAPITGLAAANAQIADRHIGLGGYLLEDVTGPTSKTEADFSFAYNLLLKKSRSSHYTNGSSDHVLSIGISVCVVQYRLDGSQLQPLNPGDPQVLSATGTRFLPDASFGVLYKWKDLFYIGASVPQFLGLTVNYSAAAQIANIKTVQELNFMSGGKCYWNGDKLYLSPLIALRWQNGGPPQGDIGLRLGMFHSLWIGAYYQSMNNFIAQFGFNVKNVFTLAYSYNINLTGYHADIGASNEISLGFTLPKNGKIWPHGEVEGGAGAGGR